MDYKTFIENKKHYYGKSGIKPVYMPDFLFDFQKHISKYAIEKGRAAIFVDTGLGKTLIELTVARNYTEITNKSVLLITPLAVAFQHIKEAERFGIAKVEYSRTGKYSTDIVICNYEQLDKFNPDEFDCVILDESSILKNFNGAIKTNVTNFMKRVKYRFLFTATPAPNDFVELGTSSEALGYLGYMDMLSQFFANNENNIRPQDIHTKFYLKPHAYEDFFRWVKSWSISMRKPSDLGFDDSRFILPELNVNKHFVKNDKNWIVDGQVMMFNIVAKRMSEVREEQKMTIENRCNKAFELTQDKDYSVYWCNFNDEGDLLEKIDNEAKQIKGSMKIEQKEEYLLAFSNGELKRLITKPKMTAFGLNWQHCNHSVYFPTFSYEQYYQAIRRFWRFGQQREVTIDMVLSDGQKRVADALIMKTKNADKMFDKLNKTLHKDFDIIHKEFNKNILKPNFI